MPLTSASPDNGQDPEVGGLSLQSEYGAAGYPPAMDADHQR